MVFFGHQLSLINNHFVRFILRSFILRRMERLDNWFLNLLPRKLKTNNAKFKAVKKTTTTSQTGQGNQTKNSKLPLSPRHRKP